MDSTHIDRVQLKRTLHLVEQATDFSNTKYIANNQSLVWSIAKSCLTFPEATSPGIPGSVYRSSDRIHKRPCK